MHTLEQLRHGELKGITRLDLSADLTHFPEEIFTLADSLEVLNLSGNRLSELPAELSRFRKLRILFCSDNRFTQVPEVLGQLPQLEMIGFKANTIRDLPAAALPRALRWLILTDNQLAELPETLGKCTQLQKLMLAGNQLRRLPSSMADCQRLELLRLSANRFEQLPPWLLRLPRLTWLAFAGNPCSDRNELQVLREHSAPPIDRDQIELMDVLGQGASGVIYRTQWHVPGQAPKAMATKLFKGTLTSDGLPRSEVAACIAAGAHPNLIRIAGPLAEQTDSPSGLLMELIDPRYQPLADPPSLSSCTRDCYAPQQRFSLDYILRLASGTAAAVAHLHERGILHGDLYAHNLLVDGDGSCLLGDFGAASFFQTEAPAGQALQQLEVRAFGCLLEELLERCTPTHQPLQMDALRQLQAQCLSQEPGQRPSFATLDRALRQLAAAD
jgi:hypothetical protein